jgi:hypothetical protein
MTRSSAKNFNFIGREAQINGLNGALGNGSANFDEGLVAQRITVAKLLQFWIRKNFSDAFLVAQIQKRQTTMVMNRVNRVNRVNLANQTSTLPDICNIQLLAFMRLS